MIHNSSKPFLIFNRKEWSTLQNNINRTLSQSEILHIKQINNNLSIHEVIEIYLPLSHLLNLHICSNLKQQSKIKHISNLAQIKYTPYIIGITGSVSSGKSTTAKILQTLLRTWSKIPVVEIVSTDNFLYPNQTLKNKNLIHKKGFPQSYNTDNLIDFIIKIKSGTQLISIPIYSHITYDIIHNFKQIIQSPAVLILEGLNVLQKYYTSHSITSHIFTSNFIDFAIYIDAPDILLKQWYIYRFLKLYNSTFTKKESYFAQFYQLSKNKLISIAASKWNQINKINLKQNILPTKKHAHLILKKGPNHKIDSILLKQGKNPYK